MDLIKIIKNVTIIDIDIFGNRICTFKTKFTESLLLTASIKPDKAKNIEIGDECHLIYKPIYNSWFLKKEHDYYRF